MPWLCLRTVTIDPGCASEFDDAAARYPRFTEAWAGIKWRFERNPQPVEAFLSLSRDGKDYYILGIDGDEAAGVPEMWLFYWYDSNAVTVCGINCTDPAAPNGEETSE